MGTIKESWKGRVKNVSNVLKMLRVRNSHKSRYGTYGVKNIGTHKSQVEEWRIMRW